MPQLGETVTEGTITKWYKQVGDTIAEDEALFEVSTEKVDSEVPSPVSGTVTEILVQVGETVPVGTKLAVIGPASQGSQGPSVEEPAHETADEAPPAAAREEEMARVPETGQQTPPARHAGQGPAQVPAKPPSGGLGRPGARPADQRPPSAPSQGGPSKLLSPVVRRLIAEHGLDPAQIAGTGAGGRITRDDVLAAIEYQGADGAGAERAAAAETLAAPAGPASTGPASAGAAPARPAPARQPLATESPAVPAPQAGERDTVVPFTNIRRRTAEHMARSKHISAHTMAAVEVDYSAVDKVRLAAREHFKATEGFSLTYLPFIARAVVDALVEWPLLNSSVGEDELIVHRDVNLGVAVDLEFEGLLVPVIHRAEEKRLVAIARRNLRPRFQGAFQAPDHGRHIRWHVHPHERGRLRDVHNGPHHQPAPGGHHLHRRRPQAPGRGRAAGR